MRCFVCCFAHSDGEASAPVGKHGDDKRMSYGDYLQVRFLISLARYVICAFFSVFFSIVTD